MTLKLVRSHEDAPAQSPDATDLAQPSERGTLTKRDIASLSLATAVAALLVVGAYLPREPLSERFGFFWLGLLLLTASYTVIFLRRSLSNRQALLALSALGVVSYLPKLLRGFSLPPYLDELEHLHQSQLLLQQGIILGHNTADPTVGFFPLFQLLAVAVHGITLLSLWHSSLFVAGVGHVAIILAVYLLFRELKFDCRVSGLAGIFYMAGPSVLFWLSEASYESIALPLAVLATTACLRAARSTSVGSVSVAALLIVATTVAQPVSALFASTLLLSLGIVDSFLSGTGYRRIGQRERVSALVLFAAGSFAMNFAWFGVTAWNQIWGYVLPSGSGLTSVFSALIHFGRHRPFFGGPQVPRYEQILGELTLLLIPIVWAAVLVTYVRGRDKMGWSSRQHLAIVVALACGGAFAASYPFDISPLTFIFVHRSWQFLWVEIALILALGIVMAVGRFEGAKARRTAILSQFGGLAFIVVVLVGNTGTGSPVDDMFAVPYHLGAGVGLVTPGQLGAARWLRKHASGARIASDSDTDIVQWAYGDVNPVPFPTWKLTESVGKIGSSTRALVRDYRLNYVVVDRLMYSQVSRAGYLYSGDEPHAFHEHPVPIRAYRRLLNTSWIKLVYANSQMSIFRLYAGQ